MTNGERSEMLGRRYRAIRGVTTSLCQTLTPEDCVAQSMTEASPAKWHLAHTTWFFETFLLSRQDSGYAVFHPRFEYLFNSYYDSVSVQFSRPDRGLLTRPSLDEVGQYRAHVDRVVAALLDDPGRLADEVLDIIELGLHHEQQHQELLLTDIKHLFAQN
ncbi:MAG: DinB family protein, partial [Myxococcota bacterium]